MHRMKYHLLENFLRIYGTIVSVSEPVKYFVFFLSLRILIFMINYSMGSGHDFSKYKHIPLERSKNKLNTLGFYS